jgi:hypothetical protein
MRGKSAAKYRQRAQNRGDEQPVSHRITLPQLSFPRKRESSVYPILPDTRVSI